MSSSTKGFTTTSEAQYKSKLLYLPSVGGAKAHRAFTIIELLVVISIIGLLSSIILVSLGTARTKAYDAQRLSNLLSVQTAIESYYATNGNYPSTSGNYNSVCVGGIYTTVSANNVVPGLIPGYIASIPVDPQSNGTTQCCYSYQGSAADYKFMFYSCPTTVACAGVAGSQPSLPNPGRANSCAVYSAGAVNW